jgi:hypothetical protein
LEFKLFTQNVFKDSSASPLSDHPTKQLAILEKLQKTCQEENFELIEDLQQIDM